MTDSYTVRVAEMQDWDDLSAFLKKAFYPQEPLSISLGVAHCPSEVDIASTMRQLAERTSLIALDSSTGNIIGCCICGEIRPSEEDAIAEEAASCECPAFQKVLQLLATMEKNGGHYWKTSGVNSALAVYAVAVDPDARRRGVARALLERARSIARERGYQLLHVDCSSAFSSKLMEQMGMECVYSLKYEHFKDSSGQPVFKPPSPHTEMRKYILKL
ncbi:arylalkylamine N-acetyltransferase-like 2 [Anabrus simplex]|uniref:arylalkylamine N-acetyltransferase-like 2 n=1 Tax=Anabrus simplex TaxID=316456 RepID=UPI0035A3B4E0